MSSDRARGTASKCGGHFRQKLVIIGVAAAKWGQYVRDDLLGTSLPCARRELSPLYQRGVDAEIQSAMSEMTKQRQSTGVMHPDVGLPERGDFPFPNATI